MTVLYCTVHRYNMLHSALLVPELYLYSRRDTVATPRKVERFIDFRVKLTARSYLQSRPEVVNELLATATASRNPSPTRPAPRSNAGGGAAAAGRAGGDESPLERATRHLVRAHLFPSGAHVAILREHPHDYERRIVDMLAIADVDASSTVTVRG